MRIYDQNTTSAAEAGRAQDVQRTQQNTSKTAGAAPGGGDDRVELSSTLGSLSRALTSFSASRAERVQSLSAQYQAGQYQVDSMAVGRAMISDRLAAGAQ